MFNAFRSGDKVASSKRLSYVQVRHLIFVSLSCFIVLGSVSAWLIAQSKYSDDPAPIAFYPVSANGTNVLLDSTTNHFNGYIPTNISVAYGPGPATNTEAIYFSAGMAATVPQTNSFTESAFTFATWYRGSGNSKTVSSIASGSDVDTNKWSLYSDANGVPHLAVSAPSGEAQVLSASSTNGLDVNDGYWHFLTGVVQTNSVQLYVDNSESQTNVDWAGKQSSYMQMGSTNTAYSPFTVSDAQLFNIALSSNQVTSVQNSSQSSGSLPSATSSDPSNPETAEASPQVGGGIHPDTGGGNTLTISAGNAQIVPVSTIAGSTLQVLLKNSSGNPVSGTSITFAIASGSDGGLATTSSGTYASTQTVTTNGSGIAAIYYESSTDLLKNNVITSTDTADSLVVTFTERCGNQTGLLSWFSADQVNGTGNALPANNAPVTSWTDLAAGNTVTQTTAANEPSFTSSDPATAEPALKFTGSQFLSNTALPSGLNGQMTIIMVGLNTNPSPIQYSVFLGQVGTHNDSRSIGYDGSVEMFDFGYGVTTSGPAVANRPVMESCTLNSGLSSVAFSQDGMTPTNVSVSGLTNLVSGMSLGGLPNAASCWQGNVQEVLIFNQLLTTAQATQITLYLSNKYGIYTPSQTGIWYNSAPYSNSNIQSEIIKNQWNRVQANAYISLQNNTSGVVTHGLLDWYAADQINGTGNALPGNGTTATAWTDLALGNNLVGSGTFVQSSNLGKPAVQMASNTGFTNSIGDGISVNQDITLIAVAASSNSSPYQQEILLGGGASGNARILGFTSSDQMVDDSYDSIPGAAAPANGTFSIQMMTLQSTNIKNFTLLQNGTQSATGSFGNTIGNPTPYIAIGNPGSNQSLIGNISEVLVYDHQLTSAEQTTINQYLGDKYGLYTPNSTWYTKAPYLQYESEIQRNQWNEIQANAYIALQNNTSGVVKTGLISWYSADQINGTGNSLPSNGATVSTWTDLALGNNVTQSSSQPTFVTADTNGNNSKPAVHFAGTQYLYSANSLGAGMNQDVSIIAVGSGANTATQQYSVDIGTAGASTQTRGIGYNNSLQAFTTWSDDATGGAVPNTNSFNIETCLLDTTLTKPTFFRNGTNTTPANPPTITKAGTITSGITVGGLAQGNSSLDWNGDISEILVYDHSLTTAEQATIYQYLGDKYKIYTPNATWYTVSPYLQYQSEIQRNQWNVVQANAYIALQSNTSGVVKTGLISWFSADQINGTGNLLPSNGAAVSSWTDLAQGNNATTASNQPTFVTADLNGNSSKPAVHFAGTQFLYNANSLGVGVNQDMSIICVSSCSNTSVEQYALDLGQANATKQTRGLGYRISDQAFTTWANDATGGPVPNANTFVIETRLLDTTLTKPTFFQDGLNTTPSPAPSISTAGNITPGISVGGLAQGYNNVDWNGDISEILVYDHSLTTAEQATIYQYLGDKYKIYTPNATWYTVSPYLQYQSEIQRNQWSKPQADKYITLQSNSSGVVTNGLLSWFSADQINGTGNALPNNGATVSTWTDLAQGNNVTTTSNLPTFLTSGSNSKPAVQFSGTQFLYNPNSLGAGVNQDMTIIAVGSSTNPTAQQYSIDLGVAGAAGKCRGIGYNNSLEAFTTWNDDADGSAVPMANTFVAEIATLNSALTTPAFYQNGILTTQSPAQTISNVGKSTPGITIGATSQGVNGFDWQGNLSEVLVYDHQLTAAELQQVGTYLANKYSTSYPALIPPTISPAAGSYSSSVTVSLGGELAPTSIHYTIDGTTPTLSSPTYSAPFTLTQSAEVSAVAFENGFVSSATSAQYYVNDPGDTGLAKPPTGLTVAAASSTQINLSWTLPTGQVTYDAIDVYRSTNGGAYELIAVLAAGSTTFSDSNAVAGTSYTYYVGTFNPDGDSPTANSSAVSPPVPSTISITVTTPSGAVNLP